MPSRVLVVEDEEDIAVLVALLLRDRGMEVATAADGRAALAEVERAMPDLILLDMKMPVMDGPAFAQAFRARWGRAAPLVAFPAAEDADRRAAAIDADASLGKPFDLPQLVALVERFVKR